MLGRRCNRSFRFRCPFSVTFIRGLMSVCLKCKILLADIIQPDSGLTLDINTPSQSMLFLLGNQESDSGD